MYTCKDAAEQLTDDREGALTGWTRVWHRLHMAVCSHCKAYRRQMDEAVAIARETSTKDVPSETMEAALAAFREHKERPRSS